MPNSVEKLHIVLDAMGGDFAPANEVQGAFDALQESNNRFHVVLVGKKEVIQQEIEKRKSHQADISANISIVDAQEIITMHDSPVAALKQKPNSSLAIGLGLQKNNSAHAFVSAGNTGAVAAASTIMLGRIPGVTRPTIAAIFPSTSGPTLLIDAGAVIDCKPHFLYEFGLMGSIYSEYIFQKKNPRIGLLNVGEEESKGDELTKETYELFKNSKAKINFVGNVEGRDILNGKADVVVCDGFIGNVLLKFGESVPTYLKKKFQEYAAQGIFQKLLMGIMRKPLRTIFKDMDYQEYGGVPLLGVNGITIIGHGSSTPKAIKNMLFRAEEMFNKKINEHIQKIIQK